MRVASSPPSERATVPMSVTTPTRAAEQMHDLDLVRQFHDGNATVAMIDELDHRVHRDRGWWVPGVAIILPDNLHGTGFEYKSLRPNVRVKRKA